MLYSAQPQQTQQISDEENQYFQEVFSADPGLLSIYAMNPRDLNLFKPRHYFLVNLNHALDVEVTSLSDDGACLNFGRAGFFKEHGITPVGNWCGKIKTINQVLDLETPFYKLNAHTNQDQYVPLFVLATEDIGFKRKAGDDVMHSIAKLCNVSSQHLQNPVGSIDILIGLKSGSLLLREVHYVNDQPVHKTFFTRDLMLSNSILTKKMVVKGAIGGQKFGRNNSIYYSDSQPANLLRTLNVQDSSY